MVEHRANLYGATGVRSKLFHNALQYDSNIWLDKVFGISYVTIYEIFFETL